MAKPSKRVQKKTNALQQEIGLLLSGLNREWPKANVATRKLLLQLVPDVGRLARIVLKLQRLVTHPPKWLEDLDSKGLEDIWEGPAYRHLRQLNNELSQYRTFPQISQDRGGWCFQWNVAYHADLDGGLINASRVQELPLVLTAIRLAEQGLIERVRRCSIDRRWFYARTKESRFCGSKCRNVFHQRDPKDKERRRKWARENYQTRKTLELDQPKPRINARFGIQEGKANEHLQTR
jgi:hypothetical protein